MVDAHLNSMMDNLYWWGIPTMFRCPHKKATSQDIALVGVPHSTGNGTTERDQHLGPRALRNVSSVGRRMHGDFQLDPWAVAKISDVGDDLKAMNSQIHEEGQNIVTPLIRRDKSCDMITVTSDLLR